MLDVILIALICLGLFFFLGASIGMIRFPGFYTRMHAAGKADTLSSVLILLGCALYVISTSGVDLASVLVSIKILLVAAFIFMGSPTATHAMMDAGFETEVDHWRKRGDR